MAKKEDGRVTMAAIRVIQVQGMKCQELQRLRERDGADSLFEPSEKG